MQGLVIGSGSIGKRHLQNLKLLGVDGLALVETEPERRAAVTSELKIRHFADLAAGLKWPPDFVVLATPTHLHAEQALSVVKERLPVFVEKPLAHCATHVWQISDLIKHNKVVSMVGCNMRFHPGPKKVRELLEKGCLGKILFSRIHAGSYLPDWRPGTDYRLNYAAKEATGGGCILDCIHEIDLAHWYLGDVAEVLCIAGHISSLEIEAEDVAALILRHATGTLSEVHLDYVQRTYERGCQIVGEGGSIFWDYRQKQVRWYDSGSDQWSTFEQPAGWEVNQMYVDEMRHFLDCVREQRTTLLPVPEAARLMDVVFAAKRSNLTKTVVSID